MSQQTQKTQSTKVNRRPRNGRGGAGPLISSFAAKKSSIPKATESENTRENFVEWGGNNLYPYYLNYLFNNNPMHSGIIRSKVYYTTAGGLNYEGADFQAWEEFYKNGKKTHLDKNLDELIQAASMDFEKSNMFVFKVKMSALEGKKVRSIDLIPFERVRFEIRKDENNRILLTGNIKYSKDWSDNTQTIHTLEPYDKANEGQKMFYVLYKTDSGQAIDEPNNRNVNPGLYPSPPYGGGITAIDTGIEIGKYNNSEIHNGFSLGTVLNLNSGAPNNEEKREELRKDIKKQATGSYAAGSVMVLFNNGKDREASVLNLNGNNLPDRYANAKKGTEESIIHAHSVTTPILFGLKTEGSLGNATELEIGYSIMKANYFKARQGALLTVLNWIAQEIEGLLGTITFNEVELNLPGETKDPAAVVVNVGEKPEKKPGTFTEDEQETILKRFREVGSSKDSFNVIYSTPIEDLDHVHEEDALQSFKKALFQDLGENALRTLNLIEQGNDFDSIRKALEISGQDLVKIYKQLQGLEMISPDGDLLELGAREVAAQDLGRIEVLYEYRLRPDAPALRGPSSRPFCVQLMDLNRLYTRDEINFISGVEGYDVFRYRGGWYTNPNSGRHEPGCRHTWQQVVVFN